MSILTNVELAPRDPLLGLFELFAQDPREKKVNLGVGVYFDDDGNLPLLECVRVAETAMAAELAPRGYLPIDGIAAYDQAVQNLVFDANSDVVKSRRIATAQSLGGTGALRVGADFLKKLTPQTKVLISTPSWSNHRGIFTQAGFDVAAYRYYDAQAHAIDFDGMLADLKAVDAGTIVVFHACCHNPTGYDLTPEQWQQVVEAVKARRITPFLDMAYQGFGQGITEDGAAVAAFVAADMPVFVANSFSKNFSLYGERVGALSVVCSSQDEAARVSSQLKTLIRTNYSNPPTHGASIVARVLNTPELRAQWEAELTTMRNRIRTMRVQLVAGLKAAGVKTDMGFIEKQTGMFSYSGLSREQMLRLRDEFGVYGTESGRFCVAALNSHNIGYVCKAIAKVV